MKSLSILFGLLWGSGLALIYLKTQSWSVRIINPSKPRLSKLLVIGGAIIRWMFVFICLLLALSYSLLAVFLVFGSFMITRLLILLQWEGIICSKLNRIKHID